MCLPARSSPIAPSFQAAPAPITTRCSSSFPSTTASSGTAERSCSMTPASSPAPSGREIVLYDTGMIPVPVPENDLGHLLGADAELQKLLANGHPVNTADQVDEVHVRRPLGAGLDAGVIEHDLSAVPDDAVVDGKLEEHLVVIGAGAAWNEGAIGDERAGRHICDRTAFDQVHLPLRHSACFTFTVTLTGIATIAVYSGHAEGTGQRKRRDYRKDPTRLDRKSVV